MKAQNEIIRFKAAQAFLPRKDFIKMANRSIETILHMADKIKVYEFANPSLLPSIRRSKKRECSKIYYEFLERARKNGLSSGDWPVEMKFMSEVESPVPDFTLLAHYRKLVRGN